MNNLHSDLELAEQPVTIAGSAYVLRELNGKQRDKYLNGMNGRLTATSDGKGQTVKNFADGLQASLVGASLYKEGEDAPVGEATVQTWPARVVASLFEAASVLSGLKTSDDEDSTEGKD